jgi:hypothetical protein
LSGGWLGISLEIIDFLIAGQSNHKKNASESKFHEFLAPLSTKIQITRQRRAGNPPIPRETHHSYINKGKLPPLLPTLHI